ncbi:MAG TPA: copper resistance CopC family protein [Nakamurella sp.]
MLSRATARSSAPAVIVLALVLLGILGLPGTASAHASLIGSDPADGAVLTSAPTVAKLTFDDNLADFEPVVTVTGPDGNQYQSGAPTVDGAQLSSAVAALPVAGTYTIAYRVVSDDGHPVEGTVSFELAAAAISPVAPVATAPATPTPATPPTTAAATTPTTSPTASPTTAPTVTSGSDNAAASSSSGWSLWQWVIVVLFVALAFLSTLIVRRRTQASTRTRSGPDQ